MEISADPLAQIARLADVNDRAEPVLHQINARLVRHFAELFANLIIDRHDGLGGSPVFPVEFILQHETQAVVDRKMKFLDQVGLIGRRSNA